MSSPTEPGPAVVIVLVRDLISVSQIRGAAERAGVPLLLVRDPGKLAAVEGVEGGGKGGVRRVILDCNLAGAVEAASAYKSRTGVGAVGFVSHVDTQTIAHARNAGIDRVVARSAFFKDVLSFLE